jgi:hypothetical protein
MHCVSLSPRYAIGALATGQLTFAQTQLHKKVVLDVAMAAKSFGKSPLLGVCYDEIARRGFVLSGGAFRPPAPPLSTGGVPPPDPLKTAAFRPQTP